VVSIDRSWTPQQMNFKDRNSDFYEADLNSQYIVALYNAILLLSGNDIYPQNEFQTVTISIITVSGALLIAHIFGTISYIVQSLNK
jgi:hypothetical protein